MCSSEALYNLEAGISAWTLYHQEKISQKFFIDLTYAELENKNFRNYDFSICDFTCAIFNTCNLDSTQFNKSILKNVSIEYSSLIDVQFESVEIHKVKFEKSDLEDANFRHVYFRNTSFDEIHIMNSQFYSCRFENCTFVASQITGSLFDNCEFIKVRYQGVIQKCKLNSCNMNKFEMSKGEFLNNEIIKCIVSDSSWYENEVVVKHNDWSCSKLIGINIAEIGPASCILLDTTFITCKWPKQSGSISLLGKYQPSKYLIRHPVQDVKALPPCLRREIADAQFLIDFIESHNSFIGRILTQLWGLTTGFGQSTFRLLIFSLVLIGTLSLLSTLSHEKILQCSISLYCLIGCTINIINAFLGFEVIALPMPMMVYKSNIWIPVARVLGFVVLGLWITIVANKIATLSK